MASIDEPDPAPVLAAAARRRGAPNAFGGWSPPLTDLVGLDPNLTDGMEVDEYLRMIRGEDKF